MTKKILVTGADGFIGSHLVHELVLAGNEVRAFCLYNSLGSVGWLEDLPRDIRDNLDIVLGDIRDSDSIARSLDGVTHIMHLASLIAIPYSYHAPESYIDTNIKGTFNVLKAARDREIEQVIHTSTSEVYGTAQFVPITEEHPLVGQSPYSASKIAADQMAQAFFCSYGLPVSTVRPFNTYGPRQSERAVIPVIITQALSKSTRIKLGNTSATRDFTFVRDTAHGMMSFLNNPKTYGRVLNLGTGREISIEETVKLISKITETPLEIEIEEKRLRPDKSEVERLCANNDKAMEILGWEPKYTLEEGLKQTIDWFERRKSESFQSNKRYVL